MAAAHPSSPGGGVIAVASPDSSLFALHVPPSGAATTAGGKIRLTVRIYDASASLGTLKQTLSANVDSSSSPEDGASSSAAASSAGRISQLEFSPSGRFLCAALRGSGEALVWDLRRGVVAHAVSVSKKQRLRGIACGVDGGGDGGKEVLYALASNVESGKLYALGHSLETGKLRRKVKCGSIDSDREEKGGGCALGVACSPNSKLLAVRNGDHIRMLSAESGERLVKCKIRDGGGGGGGGDCGLVFFSDDSSLVGASVSSGAALFRASDGEAVCVLRSDEAVSCARAFLRGSGGGVVLATEASAGAARLYSLADVALGGGGGGGGGGSERKKRRRRAPPPLLRPTSSIRTSAEEGAGVACAAFGSRRPGEAAAALLLPEARSGAGGAARVVEVGYRDGGNELRTGDVVIGSTDKEAKEDGDKGKKRKAEQQQHTGAAAQVVLGPGEGGGEALTASDATQQPASKRSKTSAEDEEDDEFVLPDDDDDGEDGGGAGGGRGRSIADRLAVLSAEMDRDYTDDEFADVDASNSDDGGGVPKFEPQTATSDSLAALLRQSLESNDDAKLEVALRVTDARVVENSVSELLKEDNQGGGGSDLIVALLSKLATRLARRPGRARELSAWLRTVLASLLAGGSRPGMEGGMGRRERDVASRLLPLRNLLNERVSCLPELMRLEGRLALLGGR